VRYRDRYLFDLQGYLTVPDALSRQAVERLNLVVDQMITDEVGEKETSHRWGNLLGRSPAFRELIDNPKVMPTLEELLGKDFRLDHEYADLIRSGMGPIGAGLHGGAVPFRSAEYYWSSESQLHSGLCVVAYNLKDVGPDDGGFACVPGSHKSSLAYPNAWKDLTDPHPSVRKVTGPAGTAIIFTEAMVHGSLPWRGGHERRTVFYKYSPRPIAWLRAEYDASLYPDLSNRQREILKAPGIEGA
jgi:hypothetical protein